MRFLVLFVTLIYLQNTVAFSLYEASLRKTCQGHCSNEFNPNDPCHCNPECLSHNNCCSDYEASCKTCKNRCNNGLDKNFPCQCNEKCKDYNDCCPDYDSECFGSSGATDDELKKISSELFDLIKTSPAQFNINFQAHINEGSHTDKSPQNLITSLDETALFSNAVFKAMLPLMDNYVADVNKEEDHTAEEQKEEDDFLDAIIETDIMKKAMTFLEEKNYFQGTQGAKDKLKELWFERYNRGTTDKNVKGSSGFEHVFIGEIKNNAVSGFHGWVHFYLEETAGNLNYYGHINNVDFGTNMYGITNIFDWNGELKPIGGGFIGTPPELDLAIYSICVLTRSSDRCPVIFNGHLFNVKAFMSVNNGRQNVGSSYPEF